MEVYCTDAITGKTYVRDGGGWRLAAEPRRSIPDWKRKRTRSEIFAAKIRAAECYLDALDYRLKIREQAEFDAAFARHLAKDVVAPIGVMRLE